MESRSEAEVSCPQMFLDQWQQEPKNELHHMLSIAETCNIVLGSISIGK